ncbi:MAG TPA: acetamidase/formamidase family protein [Nitrososphaerales archaeon]|nr:acetamidase/formamidase family protein [Nitrososphaerales archaeon]
MPSRSRIGRDTFHYKWAKSHKPAISIRDGDTVTFEVNDVASWQLTRDSRSEDLNQLDDSKLYPLAGPVFVEGAKPGDALVVETVRVKIDDFGWSAIIPGFGLLEEFKKPYLYKWDLRNKKFASFEKGIKIPIRPFCGVLGVAPPEKGSFDAMPPGKHGGNLDIRHLTAGSRIKIPVWVDGALFSAGDVHAAMGDGEVCVCAIECAGEATLRFTLEHKSSLRWPQYLAEGDPKPKKGYYAATGIAPDLMLAAKESVRNMLDYLTLTYGLTREAAYVLCSVAADVRVHEVVDQPNWVVGTMISRDIFPD